MWNPVTRNTLKTLVLTLGLYSGALVIAMLAHPMPVGASTESAALKHPEDSRRGQIKELNEQIRRLREQYEAQAAPLQAQLKALREKLDAEVKSLEAQREALYKAIYESDHWKKEIAPRIPDLLDREKMVVTRITPTTRSTAQ